jgi:hypothetical protein
MSTPTAVAGQPLNLEVRWPPGRTGLRLRLKGPGGVQGFAQLGQPQLVRDQDDTGLWRYVGSVRQPGYWEWQWEDGTGVLDYGMVRVVATGF